MSGELADVRVLIVEDDEDNRDLFAFTLERAGAEVRAVRNAADAMNAVAAWSPTVIIADLVLPHVDGFSLLREIRAQHHLREIPAIAITGRVSASDREAAFQSGFQEHVAKPVEPAVVVAIVQRWAASPQVMPPRP